MDFKNFFRWLEIYYHIPITKELQNTIEEYFRDNVNIYTDQDLYEQSRKLMQNYKDEYINKKYYKYRNYL